MRLQYCQHGGGQKSTWWRRRPGRATAVFRGAAIGRGAAAAAAAAAACATGGAVATGARRGAARRGAGAPLGRATCGAGAAGTVRVAAAREPSRLPPPPLRVVAAVARGDAARRPAPAPPPPGRGLWRPGTLAARQPSMKSLPLVPPSSPPAPLPLATFAAHGPSD
ncbi:POLG alternative reading frame-like [Schistocerca piceifrons]|uniref:POLG alternative reading frame-like n=1 Tax=Schistocerca piceifrons TaxID=274613 RepID=UPI001F5FC95E|nr:POLG alternative reading frame-like [Schistocerca piceifrons]